MNSPFSSVLTAPFSQPLLASCPLTPPCSHCTKENISPTEEASGGSHWQQQTCFLSKQEHSRFGSSHQLQTLESHHKICTRMLFPVLIYLLFSPNLSKGFTFKTFRSCILYRDLEKKITTQGKDRISERTMTILGQL